MNKIKLFALIISTLTLMPGCGDSSSESSPRITKKEITVKWYTCEKCGVRTALNDPNFSAVSTENNGKNFVPVIKSVKMGEYTPIIETERLIIRAATLEDTDQFYSWAKKKEVAQSTTWKTHTSKEKTVKCINKWINLYKQGMIAPWAIELKENGKMIGNGGIVSYFPIAYRVIVGWQLDSEYWGRGLGTEIARAMVEFAITMLGMNRVEAIARTDNVASRRVLEKAGMTHEGLFREYFMVKKQLLDIHQYAVIKSDIADEIQKSICYTYPSVYADE